MKLPYASKAANFKKSVALLIVTLLSAISIAAQTTAFTYQGKLTDSGNPANGQYDFQFRLFNAVSGGTQLGSPVVLTNVTVTNGSFTVTLDFGACPTCFDGTARFLEIAVKPTSGSTFTNLSPRQQVNSTPYAIKSLNAANATTADGLSVACVNCVTSSQIASVNGSAVTGTIPVTSVPSGSANYIQNTISQQATSNFNISGNGIIGGNVGIGTTSPLSKLHVVGDFVRFDLNSKTLDFTTGSVLDIKARTTSLAISAEGANGNNNLHLNPNSINGSVTIGTFAPSAKFTVGSGNIFVGGVNNFASDGDTAMINLGDSNHYIRSVRGSGVRIGTFGVGDAITLLQSSGNVGIGTTTPFAKLEVSGTGIIRARINSDSNAGVALNLNEQSRWSLATATGGNFQIYNDFTSQNALWINGTNNNVGIGTTTPNSKLQVIGNATQDMNSGGLVKAMVFVLANGTIARCYNGVTGATTNGCGFSVSTFHSGNEYLVDFGFDVTARFASVTSYATVGTGSSPAFIVARSYRAINDPSTVLRVFTFFTTDGGTGDVVSDFFIIVY